MAEIETLRLDGYRRLIEISRDLASTLDLDILLARIVYAAAEVTGAEAASILLYDDAAKQLYFQVATNIDEPTRRGIVVPLDGSIAGWMVMNRKPARINDVHDDPRFFGDVEQTTGFTTHVYRVVDAGVTFAAIVNGSQAGFEPISYEWFSPLLGERILDLVSGD